MYRKYIRCISNKEHLYSKNLMLTIKIGIMPSSRSGGWGELMKPSPTPLNHGGLSPNNRGANWGDPWGAIVGGLYPSKKGAYDI